MQVSSISLSQIEACYDVLNQVAVKSGLGKGRAYEVNLVNEMLKEINPHDLLLFDRGYAAYEFIADLSRLNLNYLIRCTKSSFIAVQDLFENADRDDVIVNLTVPTKHAKRLRRLGLPTEIKVRLVRVILASGEIEVLATSLMDQQLFPTALFKELYHLRWGVETFFSKLKGRLCLENFTGKSVEAIQQDFWSTIFISNLETMMTEGVEERLNADLTDGQLPRSINKAVSFNAIKNLAFEILSTETNKEQVIAQLTQLFLTNTLVVRVDRKVPRNKISDTRSLNYQRRFKKHVF